MERYRSLEQKSRKITSNIFLDETFVRERYVPCREEVSNLLPGGEAVREQERGGNIREFPHESVLAPGSDVGSA